ncbi:hypothetical protein [Moorena sp. SIO4G3]|uniref:hypothetical protein n=1 Tax=Moorena sp. SIO4G3 TaxID=2607821 RepID=UPI00142CB380|nr:hypothetical protein [Moorena sp. SIO4G3]NEO78095.1 hypothetical protein [Moorena sp. SIO4G3]
MRECGNRESGIGNRESGIGNLELGMRESGRILETNTAVRKSIYFSKRAKLLYIKPLISKYVIFLNFEF